MGPLVDGILALLVMWLLARSFAFPKQIAELEKTQLKELTALRERLTEEITDSRMDLAGLRGQFEQVNHRLSSMQTTIEAGIEDRGTLRQQERESRHELGNKLQAITGELEERLRVAELALEGIKQRRTPP